MEWIDFGYWGMFFSSILAATILPFGSEAVFLGLLYGELNPFTLVIVAGIGNTIGGMITYYMGRLGKWVWLEKWFKIKPKSFEKYMHSIQKRGWLFAFFTWLPGIGDPLAVGLGYARTHPITALLWMFIGKTLRFLIIALMWKYSIELW